MKTSAPAPGSRPVKTRFAPSPTGYLHIGGARTALFSWAYARHYGGQFVLRIEDTDRQRSTPEAVRAILDGMAWLGLSADEAPIYQTERMDRYAQVIAQMLAQGLAYYCWCTPAELDELREAQRAHGLKPRYDGRWRPEKAAGRQPPAGVAPVVRFRNPDDGAVQWTDLVKGPISIANGELDDLIIARADGTPTYNFCVVVDDADMGITHVIRGDDHVNNTPRQINILRAIGAPVPEYGHVPMIHGPDGQKLSKRHGAVSVMQYDEAGYLPEAVINYLARLGWSHGDDELFDRERLVAWFDGSHLSQSPAQFDPEKLDWVNQHYLRAADDGWLADAVRPRLLKRLGVAALDPALAAGLAGQCALLKERASTLEALADELTMFHATPDPTDPALRDEFAKRSVPATLPALADLARALATLDWTPDAISAVVKETVGRHGLKMPQLAMPMRLLVFGRAQTPALERVLSSMPSAVVGARLAAGLIALGAGGERHGG
ncbi:MAG: glutamate--tRNA ligase [Burkholderiaceae bacterium]